MLIQVISIILSICVISLLIYISFGKPKVDCLPDKDSEDLDDKGYVKKCMLGVDHCLEGPDRCTPKCIKGLLDRGECSGCLKEENGKRGNYELCHNYCSSVSNS